MKLSFFQAVVVSILLYGCAARTLTKRLEKKLDGNYTRIAASNIEQVLEATHPQSTNYTATYLPSRKLSKLRRIRHAGHCWRSRDELISDVLLWNPTYGRAKVGRPARTYIQQLCEDTGRSPGDLPEAMNDREKWQERVKDIRASSTTWWWWCMVCANSFNHQASAASLCVEIVFKLKYKFFKFVFKNLKTNVLYSRDFTNTLNDVSSLSTECEEAKSKPRCSHYLFFS